MTEKIDNDPSEPDPDQISDLPIGGDVSVGKIETNDLSLQPAARNDLKPVLEFGDVNISDLKSAKNAVKKLKKKHIARITSSIEMTGFVNPILARKDGEIIDGQARVEAARQLGIQSIPCIYVDHLSEPELRRARIALNKIQENGTWDLTALKLEFEYQLEFGTDLELIGFEAPEIDSVLGIGVGTSTEPDPLDSFDDLVDSDAPCVTELGDLWLLDGHRILCGNARSARDVVQLVEDRSVAMVFTDPPYNVPIKGHVRVGDGPYEEFAEASGEMSPKEFTAFLTQVLANACCTLAPGGLAFVFMDWRHMDEMSEALRNTDLHLINLCVWAKSKGGMGSLYRSRHELVFVAKRKGEPHRNNVELGKHGRNRTNVWEYAGATGGAGASEDDFSLHPTVKPVRLVMDAILDVTALGEVVLDPFLGSGTSLLTAERTHRTCFGLEISPAYVDVAIRRWQHLTGLDAIHADTGQTFNQRSATRAATQGSCEDEAQSAAAEPKLPPNPDGEVF